MTAQQYHSAGKAAFFSVGCKLNHYEMESLKETFRREGYKIVDFREKADLYVINTCTVTQAADADSRKVVRRARRANPDARVVATGCYAQRSPEELAETVGVDLVLGNCEKADLFRYVQERISGEDAKRPIFVSPDPRRTKFLTAAGSYRGEPTRASVQIQDGCNERCTYCIIPTVRGGSVSRPISEIVRQASELARTGYREIALTGVNSGSYGMEGDRPVDLVDLLEQLAQIEGLQRIRLNSIEPRYLSDRLIDFVACSAKVCRHFHVPLQSGDDEILRRMGRRYRAAEYAKWIEKIHDRIPDSGIGADVMVGFPGETDRHFENTCDLVARLPLTYLHVFAYSERAGTPAVRMDGPLDPETKKARSRAMIALGRRKRIAFHRKFLNKKLDILVERKRDKITGFLSGLSDTYLRALFDGPDELVNRMVTVRVVQSRDDGVMGVLESRYM